MRSLLAAIIIVALPAPSSGIEVIVVGPGRKPVANARVYVIDSTSEKQSSGETNDQGKLKLSDLVCDSVTVLCAHSDYAAFLKRKHATKSPLRIELKQATDVGATIINTDDGEIPGLSGQLRLIIDKRDRLFAYSSEFTLNDGREQLQHIKLGRPMRAKDADGNRAELKVLAVNGQHALVEYRKGSPEIKVNDGEVLVTDVSGKPIADAQVYLIHPTRKTHIKAVTDNRGIAAFDEEVGGDSVTVFCAHPSFQAYREVGHSLTRPLQIELVAQQQIGSLIVDGAGHVPGLEGRLNPILDNLNRLYMYADNISLNGGQQQPVKFRLGVPIAAIDAKGNPFQLVVIDIIGKTSLLEFQAR